MGRPQPVSDRDSNADETNGKGIVVEGAKKSVAAQSDRSQPANVDSQRSGAPGGNGFQSLFQTKFNQKYNLTPGCRSGVEIEREAQNTQRFQKEKQANGAQ